MQGIHRVGCVGMVGEILSIYNFLDATEVSYHHSLFDLTIN